MKLLERRTLVGALYRSGSVLSATSLVVVQTSDRVEALLTKAFISWGGFYSTLFNRLDDKGVENFWRNHIGGVSP